MVALPYHQRIVAGTSAQVSWQQIGGDGEPVDPGTVTVTVTRADGTSLAAGAATTGSGTSARTYTLSAAVTAVLDRLTVAWSSAGVVLATTEVDVTAAPWFSNAELRAAESAVRDIATYTPARITIARLLTEAFFERVTHVRFVPGYSLEMLPGSGSARLVVGHPYVRRVRSASLFSDPAQPAFETLAAGELAAIPASSSGVVSRYQGVWCADWVRIGYEWGHAFPPADLRRQAMRFCREVLLGDKSQIPDAAVTWSSTEAGGFSSVLVTPGVRGAHTRLPSVNEALDAWTFT